MTNEYHTNVYANRRLWLLLLVGLLAVVLAFWSIPDSLALAFVSKSGFWIILVTFLIWATAVWRACTPALRGVTFRSVDWISVAVIVGAGVVLLAHEKFGFKIVMDEIMLLGTSMSMHLDKTVLTPTRGHDINGAFMLFDGMLDKRPLFFPFLVSLLHDVFRYRPTNPFVLNGALTFIFLSLVFITGRMLAGRVAGWFGVLLFTGLPLLAHNCTGGGFELLNLTMLLSTLLLGARWVDRRDDPSLVAFTFSGMLLAQVRYESAIFLLPVGILILLVWLWEKRVILPWPILISPLLLVHLPLHHRIFQLRESSWEMFSKPGYSTPFSVNYIPENLEHALTFFFGPATNHPNSIVLSSLGVIALPFFALLVIKQLRSLLRQSAITISVCIFGVGLGLHFIVLMCYFWGKFDEPVIRRLSLPAHLTMVVALLAILPQFPHRYIRRGLIAAAVVGLLGRAIPSMATHAYSQVYLPGRETAWRREFMQAQPHADYFMIDRDSILWVTHGISSSPTSVAFARREDLAFHMRNRTFSNIFVFQRLEIEPATGARTIRAGDDLGPAFTLEPLAEARLEVLSISRISRVTAINKDDITITEPAPISPTTRKSRAEIEAARRAFHENFVKRLP